MSFFNWPVEKDNLVTHEIEARHRAMLGMLQTFGRAFPKIYYKLLWESRSINAQAWCFGDQRFVWVYGGLARHPSMTEAGLSLVLAHETGHHLGGEPRDPSMPWLTWQGQADFWAASIGMPIVWGTRAQSLTLRGADEIAAIHSCFVNEMVPCDGPDDLSPALRIEIFRAGALGGQMPASAREAFRLLTVS
jgi:Peptidase family M48